MELVGVSEHPPTDDADEVLVTFRKSNGVLVNVTVKDAELRAKFDDVKARRAAADDARTAAEKTARQTHIAAHLALEKEHQAHTAKAGALALAQYEAAIAPPTPAPTEAPTEADPA